MDRTNIKTHRQDACATKDNMRKPRYFTAFYRFLRLFTSKKRFYEQPMQRLAFATLPPSLHFGATRRRDKQNYGIYTFYGSFTTETREGPGVGTHGRVARARGSACGNPCNYQLSTIINMMTKFSQCRAPAETESRSRTSASLSAWLGLAESQGESSSVKVSQSKKRKMEGEISRRVKVALAGWQIINRGPCKSLVAALCERRKSVNFHENRGRSQTAATEKPAFAEVSNRKSPLFPYFKQHCTSPR
jgi:hypothetical protein